ncbi:MAG: reverse transcriptase domain-containing protein, partial [Candidatus Bipolaricaulota bacterium]
MNIDAPWPEAEAASQRVLKIQTKLHQWASSAPDRRFEDLWNLVYDPAVLVEAWRRVRSNRGARSAGVDGETAHYVQAVRGEQAFLSDEWIVEGDIKACFDEISHAALLQRLRARIADRRVLGLVKAFLKSGILGEDRVLRETSTGAPQGGILSPLLSNVALTVLDEHFVAAWHTLGDSHQREQRRRKGLANYRLVRYADDWVLMVAGTRADAERLREEAAVVLLPMGLRLSQEKTRIVHIDQGFDFLGVRIQRHQRRGSPKRFVYTYPSRAALVAVKAKVRGATCGSTNQSLAVLLHRLNPVLRGWTTYHRHGAAAKTFAYLSAFTWRRVWGWLCR